MDHGPIPVELAKKLRVLQQRIEAAQVPPTKLDESIKLATWNVRDFGKKARLEDSIHFIAEIIFQFDLVCLIELRDDLRDLQLVMRLLGPDWSVVYSDMIPDAGGNAERIAFLFDKRAVRFTGLSAEANPPRVKKGEEYVSLIDWWRAPYAASFRSGQFDFVVLAAHIRWGDSTAGREGELQLLADWVAAKAADKHAEDRDFFVVGDFNIDRIDGPLFKAITSRGLQLPQALRAGEFGSDLARKKRYDQILHLPGYADNFTGAGGVLDFFAGDFAPLFGAMTKQKCTFQLSDHLPLWVQVNTDVAGKKLDQIIAGGG